MILTKKTIKNYSGKLDNLRERVFNSKQERNANRSRSKKRKKGKLPHNQPASQPLDELEVALERQRKQMYRAGIATSVKTLYGLTEHLYNRLFPHNEMIRQDVLSQKWIHIDESPINFYNPKKSKGYVWSMSNPRGAYYQFEPTRSGKVAKEMLQGYREGNVITDGFSGYDFLHGSNEEEYKNINHAYCWAHVQRKFFEAMNHDTKDDLPVSSRVKRSIKTI